MKEAAPERAAADNNLGSHQLGKAGAKVALVARNEADLGSVRAVIEAALSSRRRSPRIAEMIQRAIPYPVLLVMVEGSGYCVSVAHKIELKSYV